jgi:hypothetical protein
MVVVLPVMVLDVKINALLNALSFCDLNHVYVSTSHACLVVYIVGQFCITLRWTL